MYLPGMDRQLAQIYYNDMLQAAATERAQRQSVAGWLKPARPALTFVLAAAAPLTVLMIWVLVAH